MITPSTPRSRCSDQRTGTRRRYVPLSTIGSSTNGTDANPRMLATCIGG
jgi:hypothetical protein